MLKNLRRIYVDLHPSSVDRIESICTTHTIRRTPFLRNLVQSALGNEEVLTEAITYTQHPYHRPGTVA